MRQITASVTFLPLLDEPCSFDLLVRPAYLLVIYIILLCGLLVPVEWLGGWGTGVASCTATQFSFFVTRAPVAAAAPLPVSTRPLQVYTSNECEVPSQWEESDPRYITNAAEVKLRSFSTKVHKVDTMVAYKMD